MEKISEQTMDAVQVSLFDDLLDQLQTSGTSSNIAAVIEKLKKAKSNAQKREKEDRRRKEELEALRKRQARRQAQEEHIRQVTSMDLPMDWENLFAGDSRAEDIHADSISDGLILSLSNLGRVDIEYISTITGQDLKTIISTLKGSIYQNPENWEECFYKGWETAEEYLSGNMVSKWKSAKEADKKYKGYFADNVKAIEAVLPPTLSADEIYITLGSPWVSTDIIDDFIRHILKLPGDNYEWTALYIMERTLNMKTVSVTNEVICNTNKSVKSESSISRKPWRHWKSSKSSSRNFRNGFGKTRHGRAVWK